MGTMVVEEKCTIDKVYECKQVFKTDDIKHPGVAKVMVQGRSQSGRSGQGVQRGRISR